LTAAAGGAFSRLRTAALIDRIRIAPVSGFRSIDYQARLIATKLQHGLTLKEILAVSALPGYSEHHLGTTVDLHAGDGRALETSFESTAAFRWLQGNAQRFGFHMSYPRDNRWGIAYEPWHWRYQSPALASTM
jgi:D-alanyl-D-alanine carboxypeptidase